jgi:sporulation protein YlmC with PRC-barrel domain
MEFHFGTAVEPSDGIRYGDLRRVVYDPETLEVVYLVVETADTDDDEILVPMGSIESADADIVQAALSTEQFDSLDQFAWSRNLAPPPNRDYADIDEEDEIAPGTESPPVGAATGIESIAFTPIIEEEEYIPTGDGVIDADTEVWGTDGLLGKLRAVEVDDQTRRMASFTVREGTIFTHDVAVPVDWVDVIRPESIALTVDRGAVEAANPE